MQLADFACAPPQASVLCWRALVWDSAAEQRCEAYQQDANWSPCWRDQYSHAVVAERSISLFVKKVRVDCCRR